MIPADKVRELAEGVYDRAEHESRGTGMCECRDCGVKLLQAAAIVFMQYMREQAWRECIDQNSHAMPMTSAELACKQCAAAIRAIQIEGEQP